MLGKIFSPFTSATAGGVATRDVTMIIGAILAVLGVLGFLSEDQVKSLTEQAPVIFTAIGTVVTIGMSIYRIITKSSSDKAAEAAKEIDAKVPVSSPVEIVTPGNAPNIIVPAK